MILVISVRMRSVFIPLFADESEGPAFHALSAVDDACGLAAGPYTHSTTAICDDRFPFLSSQACLFLNHSV
jgi:hypothetical protein